MTARYPVLLRLAGERCLVVGGGPVAERKVRGLLAVDALVTVLAPHATEALAALASERSVLWEHRSYAMGDAGNPDAADGAWAWRFVVAATDDPALNRRVVADATTVGTWANDATADDGGPASLPAVHREGPVTLAVATGGAHPGAATWLRDRVAAEIAPEHVVALELVDELRRDLGVSGVTAPRPDWRQVLDSGMLDLIREGHLAEAKERLQACLSSSSD